jgi:AcrR family transcriptional regulator
MPNKKRNTPELETKLNQKNAIEASPKVKRSITDVAREAVTQKAMEQTARKTGRPRSNVSEDAIMDAASKLLLTSSVRDVSIEAIAKKAGVGKTTIYRWWPNKVAVILDAILDKHAPSVDLVSGGSPQDMLVKHLERFVRLMKGRNGKIISEILAEAQGDQETLNVFYDQFMTSYEENLASIIDQGKKTGVFRSDLNTEMSVDMIYGSLFYHLMSNHSAIDTNYADRFIMESLRMVK